MRYSLFFKTEVLLRNETEVSERNKNPGITDETVKEDWCEIATSLKERKNPLLR